MAEVIIIDRPREWRNNKLRSRKPYKIKGSDWHTGSGGDVTVYRKNGDPVISLSEGEWRKVRRG